MRNPLRTSESEVSASAAIAGPMTGHSADRDAATVDQDQRRNAVGAPDGGVHRNFATHRTAAENRPINFQMIEKLDNQISLRAPRVIAVGFARKAEAFQIDRDHAELL
jgi:hypothetical protein